MDGRSGVELIAAERQRQIDEEGRTLEHDLTHNRGELAWAAACYAAPWSIYVKGETNRGAIHFSNPWPVEWTPNFNRGEPGYVDWRCPDADRLRQLVKAGALIAAEIDRLAAVGVPADQERNEQ